MKKPLDSGLTEQLNHSLKKDPLRYRVVLHRVTEQKEKFRPFLRPTPFCKNLVDSSVTLEKVAMLAGHESLDTTKIYCRPSHADLSEAVELISENE